MQDNTIEVDNRPDRIEPSLTPGGHLGVEVGVDLGDEGSRHVYAVEFPDDVLDVASGQSLGVQGEDLLIETGEAALVLGNELGFKVAVAVAWDVEGEFA